MFVCVYIYLHIYSKISCISRQQWQTTRKNKDKVVFILVSENIKNQGITLTKYMKDERCYRKLK